jgi:hypothetical protein
MKADPVDRNKFAKTLGQGLSNNGIVGICSGRFV